MKTKAEQRIETAKDVLKWIKAEKIKAISCNGYFVPITNSKYKGRQLKDVLPEIKKCEVCAKGAMFYAHVMRHNELIIPERGIKSLNTDADRCVNLTMFTPRMFFQIECAFEHGGYAKDNNLKTDEKILKHIMNNIITNKGTFKP